MKNNFYNHEDQKITENKNEAKNNESAARMKAQLRDVINEGKNLADNVKNKGAKNSQDNCKGK